MSTSDDPLIANSLLRLLADGMSFSTRCRTLQMRALSLGLDVPPEVWDSSDIDLVCQTMARAIGAIGGTIPFDIQHLIDMSSFPTGTCDRRLDSIGEILNQHTEDRRLIIQNALFLFEIFKDLNEKSMQNLIKDIIETHCQRIDLKY